MDNYDVSLIKIGLKVAYYRKLRGYSQEELAERVGISLGFLGQIEAPNITRGLSLQTLFDIAQALNIPAYKLLRFEDD